MSLLIGFERLLDVLKSAIFWSSFRLFRLFWSWLLINEINFFLGKLYKKRLLLESSYNGELCLWVQFDLNNTLTFWKKLDMRNKIRLYVTFNQQNFLITLHNYRRNEHSIGYKKLSLSFALHKETKQNKANGDNS